MLYQHGNFGTQCYIGICWERNDKDAVNERLGASIRNPFAGLLIFEVLMAIQEFH